MLTKEVTEIGVVIVTYSTEGKVVAYSFRPTIMIRSDGLKDQMKKLDGTNEDEVSVRSNANLVFGSWFKEIADIDMADRDKYVVISYLTSCEKYPDGKVSKSTLRYVLEEIVDK